MDKPRIPHDAELDSLQDAVFDAFAAYWRGRASAQAEQLWTAYRALEEQLSEARIPHTASESPHNMQ